MAGTSCEQGFLDSDRDSDDETFGNFGNNETTEDGLLRHFRPLSLASVDPVLIERFTDCLRVENLEPYTGMSFTSLEDAKNFYCEYAKQTGFTIRSNRIRHSLKNMAVIGREFVCSREGFRAAKHMLRKDRVLPPQPVTREGCKAMIRLAARDGGKWIVTKFVRDHNHKLMTHCKCPGELPIINILSKEEKDKKIRDLYDELRRERERSTGFKQQLHTILKDIENHTEFVSLRVDDIVNSMKLIELI